MPGRGDPLIQTVAAAPAVTRLAGRIEAGVLGTSTGVVSLTGAPPGLFPYLLEAVGAPLGLRWAVVFAHERDAAAFARDAASVLGGARVALFPAPALSPYQGIAPSLKVRRDEFGTLQRLASGEVSVLVVPARALLRALPPPAEFARRTRRVAAGDEVTPARLVEGLLAEGYARVDLVTETGDVAVRGGLVDVFPPDRDEPVRIEFDLNAVASLRSFDPDTQRSTGALSAVALPPMALTPDTRETREAAQRVLAACRTADDDPPVPRDLSLARRNDGLEEILPLLDGRDAAHVLDHARGHVLAVDDADAVAAELVRAADVLSLDYGKARAAGRVAPDPARLAGDADRRRGGRRARGAPRARAGRARRRGRRDRRGVRRLLRGPSPGRAEGDRAGAAGRPRGRPRRPDARRARARRAPPRRVRGGPPGSGLRPDLAARARRVPRRRGRPADGIPVPPRGAAPPHRDGPLRRAADRGGPAQVGVRGVPLGPEGPARRRRRRPPGLRPRPLRRPRADRRRGRRARDGRPALRGRREAPRPGRAPRPDPEVRLGGRRARSRARPPRRGRAGRDASRP